MTSRDDLKFPRAIGGVRNAIDLGWAAKPECPGAVRNRWLNEHTPNGACKWGS